MRAPGVVEVQLRDRGWAVQWLIRRAVEQYLDDRHVLTRDDALRMRGDAVLEVAREQGGEMVAAAALDAIGHAE